MFRDGHSSTPFARSFHPELGYLCPSAGLRRRLRRLAKLMLVAVAVAGGSALGLSSALVGPPAEETARVKLEAAALAPPSREPIAGEQAASERAMPAALAVDVPRTAALAHAQTCNDLSQSFLSLQCRSGRKAHAATAASRRVASVPLGRVDAPAEVQGDSRQPLEAATGARAKVAPADKPAKKPAKTAQKPAPIRDNAEPAVAGSVPSPVLGLLGLLRSLPHLVSGPFATSER